MLSKPNYIIDGRTIPSGDPGLQRALAEAYQQGQRPLCHCKTPSPEMAIAFINHQYVVKRMPGSGAQHSPDCLSYEIPIELSGLAQVAEQAIQENSDTGVTMLKLGYALSKMPARVAPIPNGNGHSSSVKTDGNKLSLRGTLHYLWEQAEFNKWYPAMVNKRNWYIIRKYLLEAAINKTTKGLPLETFLFIPEPFHLADKENIIKRRQQALTHLHTPSKTNKPYMLLIGEVKETAKTRFDYKVIIKHLPDFPFYLNEDLHRRLENRFKNEIELWRTHEDHHLIMIAIFGLSTSGLATIEEASLMMVNNHWLPYENGEEMTLLEQLTSASLRFTKPFRYNLSTDLPIASAVLTDNDQIKAIFVSPASASDSYLTELNHLMTHSTLDNCLWENGTDVSTLEHIGN